MVRSAASAAAAAAATTHYSLGSVFCVSEIVNHAGSAAAVPARLCVHIFFCVKFISLPHLFPPSLISCARARARFWCATFTSLEDVCARTRGKRSYEAHTRASGALITDMDKYTHTHTLHTRVQFTGFSSAVAS